MGHMDCDGGSKEFCGYGREGQLSGIKCREKAIQKTAGESKAYMCLLYEKSNKDIIGKREEMAREAEKREGKQKEDDVPKELRLAYRDELGKGRENDGDDRRNSRCREARR